MSDSARKRNNMDKYANEYGKRLNDFCKHAGARILNGRCMGDLNGSFTCFQWNGSSTVDYCIAQEDLLQSIQFFKVHEFRGLLSNHCKISIQLPTGSRIHLSEVNLHKLQKIKWSDKVSLQYQEAIQDSRVLEAVKSLGSEVHTKDINALVDGISTLLVSALPKQKAPARHRKKKRSKSKKMV